jgi:hypothetical protein
VTFTFLVWNVEHFAPDPGRTKIVADTIKAAHPQNKDIDVMGILEVKDVNVTELMLTHFPNYDFYITDGPQVQEILVGVRRGVFEQKIFTQKREFKVGNERLRPGALMSLRQAGSQRWTQLLFLHTDSGTAAGDFGNRFEMFEKVAKLRTALAKQAASTDRLIALGDLNTMGLNYPARSRVRIKGSEEIAELARFTGMTVAEKDVAATWRDANGRIKDSNLDHVLHSPNVQLALLGIASNGNAVPIHTAGWPKMPGADGARFVETISDHAILVGETLD